MDNKNLILAFALSMGVLFGWSWMFPSAEPVQQAEQTENRNATTASNQTGQSSAGISSTTETSIQEIGRASCRERVCLDV